MSIPEGKDALNIQQENNVQIVDGEPGKGSSYDPKTHTLTLDPTDPNQNGTFVEKMAEIDYLHKHKGDLNLNPQTATSRDAYINAELDKEAYAHAQEFAYDQAAGIQTGSPLQSAYQQAIDAFKHNHPDATQAQLQAAGEKAIRDVIGQTTVAGSPTGQTYGQLYGSTFDSQGPSGLPGPWSPIGSPKLPLPSGPSGKGILGKLFGTQSPSGPSGLDILELMADGKL